MGYDPEMGARPVRRVIQQQVEEQLSDGLLAGDFGSGDLVLIDLEEFSVRKANRGTRCPQKKTARKKQKTQR